MSFLDLSNVRLASPSGLAFLALFGLSLAVLRLIWTISYNLFFSPLRHYPGPKLWAATWLPFSYYNVRGKLPFHVKRLHEKYGPVVRIAPTHLAYISATAWKEIYGHRQGHAQKPKDPLVYPEQPPHFPHEANMILANDANHSRHRRLLAHAFSAKALEEQEPLIMSYIDLLMTRLRENCAKGPIDMVALFNWTTFDVIGDLSFGEPFQSLENMAAHPWIKTIMANISVGCAMSELRRYGLMGLVNLLIPKRLLAERDAFWDYVHTQMIKRLSHGSERPDFMSFMMRNQDKEGATMTASELEMNSMVLVVAGSETTATLLSGVTYCLLRHPQIMAKVVKEVRETFRGEADINFASISQLSYMLAVLNEGLRFYPPAPHGLARKVLAGGDMIEGQFVPGGTTVAVFQWAGSRSALNFKDPDKFIPERWLDEYKEQFEFDQKDSFNPFSAGPRACLGKNLAYVEMRIILARLIWNFDLELADKNVDWMDHKAFLIWDKIPLLVKLTPVKRV